MGTRRSILWVLTLVLLTAGAVHAELVGHWTLDEGAGSVVHDSGPNGNDGTFVGSPQWIPGVVGTALEFNGNSYVDCGNDETLDVTGPFSAALWIRPGTLGNVETAPLSKADSALGWSWQLRYGWGAAQPTVMGWQFNGDGGRVWVYVEQELPMDEWAHITAAHDGHVVKCYLNAVETAAEDMDGFVGNDSHFLIGSDGWRSDWVGAIDDVRLYDHGLSDKEVLEAMLAFGPELASEPAPADEATDVDRDTTLNWLPGEFAAGHDVYLGTVFDDVNDATRADPRGVLLTQGHAEATVAPGRLEFDQTYYWRVDEVNAAPDETIFKGEIWSFTTEPLAYPVTGVVATTNVESEPGVGPERALDGSGLDDQNRHSIDARDMWLVRPDADTTLWIQFDLGSVCKLHQIVVWNYNAEFEALLGFGIKDVTVDYSSDGAAWTTLGDVTLTQAPGEPGYEANTAIDFAGVPVRYVRLTVNSGYGMMGQVGLSEVRFLTIPAQARNPEPADGAADVAVDAELIWRVGRGAVTHEVYLDAVDATTRLGTTTENAYRPEALQFAAVYYWKVTEVNEAEAMPAWDSPVWTFTTQAYGAIDDFESYTDDEDNRIYETWLDGWSNQTGATVGYMNAPFAEQTTVHGGAQSMPLRYNNAVTPFYSEAFRTWDGGTDWTASGAETLRLFVQGVAGNEPATLYVAIEDTAGNVAVATCPDDQIAVAIDWVEWQIPFSDLTGVDLSRVATLAIGLGDREAPTAGGTGTILVDDIEIGRPGD